MTIEISWRQHLQRLVRKHGSESIETLILLRGKLTQPYRRSTPCRPLCGDMAIRYPACEPIIR
jgi:hypothetical protein